jgi:hypothetical protein
VTLADQIIEHGPYYAAQLNPITAPTADELNALRDELIELRKLRASVWVALDIEEATIVAVAATAELAKVEAEADNGAPLTWRERRDGRFTSGDLDYPEYRVQPFELVRRADEHTEECGR